MHTILLLLQAVAVLLDWPVPPPVLTDWPVPPPA